jgi:protein O-mannosyl-transferase
LLSILLEDVEGDDRTKATPLPGRDGGAGDWDALAERPAAGADNVLTQAVVAGAAGTRRGDRRHRRRIARPWAAARIPSDSEDADVAFAEVWNLSARRWALIVAAVRSDFSLVRRIAGTAIIRRVPKVRRSRNPPRSNRPVGESRPIGAAEGPYHRRLWALAAGVAAVGIMVYLRALGNGFTSWDDPGYVVENSDLGPFDAHFLAWAFTTLRQENWHPLTWLSLGIDHAIFGVAPLGYHLSNVLLHGLTTLVVVLLSSSLFARGLGARDDRSLLASGLIGLIFAVHPLHVESVAWVSERKDVLCGVFYALAVLFYLRFAEQRRRAQYLASLGAFVLALLAKPMAVSLPFVLLILDAYPLARLSRSRWVRVAVEKVPFVALAVASSVVTLVAQWRGGAVITLQHKGLAARLWGAERALGFYLSKVVLPFDLAPLYPIGSQSPWRWDVLVSLALVVAVSSAAVLGRRRLPLIGALWAAYLVMLSPVLGIVQVGEQAAADRYMYLPLLAPAIAIAAIFVQFWQRGRRTRYVLGSLAIFLLVGLSTLTVRQIGVWKDTPTLWTWAIDKQPGAAMAHYNLGEYLRESGDLDGAAKCWRRAVELEPSFSWPLNQLANQAALRGARDEARSYYERATQVNQYDAVAQYNFATFLEHEGQVAEARAHYQMFLQVATAKVADLLPEVRAKLATTASQ